MTQQPGASPIRQESGVFGPRQMAEETAVYRIFDAQDVLLYVGMSVSPETRFADHRTCKAWMREAHRYEIAWFGIREEAEVEEQRAIAQEKPLHNTVHVPRAVRSVVLSAPGTYTVAEMAERFGVSTTAIRAAARSIGFPAPVGAAPSGRRGARYPVGAVDEYWARRQEGITQGKRTDLAKKEPGEPVSGYRNSGLSREDYEAREQLLDTAVLVEGRWPGEYSALCRDLRDLADTISEEAGA